MISYQKVFARLNEKLAQANLELELYCVGGFVLEYYGMKATDDIDAFYESSERIEQIIREIGLEFHIGTQTENWLNNTVQEVMSKPQNTDGDVIFSDSNLLVRIAPLSKIILDKIAVGREKDIPDIAKLMKKLDIKSPDSLIKQVMLSETESDPAIILEAFGLAYGESSLKDYLLKNPDILRLLK